jgi:hypothetical protein
MPYADHLSLEERKSGMFDCWGKQFGVNGVFWRGNFVPGFFTPAKGGNSKNCWVVTGFTNGVAGSDAVGLLFIPEGTGR